MTPGLETLNVHALYSCTVGDIATLVLAPSLPHHLPCSCALAGAGCLPVGHTIGAGLGTVQWAGAAAQLRDSELVRVLCAVQLPQD